VVVAERAKSAGTLIALAADEIVMGSTSELGPIDPQVEVTAADGSQVSRPVHCFLDGLEQIKQSAKEEGTLNPAYQPLLAQLDPALLGFCEKAIQRSQDFARKWLLAHMLRGQPELADRIAWRLARDKEYISSHGRVIGWQDARELGLQVLYLTPDDELWKLLWQLFLAYLIARQNDGLTKAFESTRVSVLM
jgi:hypothetical protein